MRYRYFLMAAAVLCLAMSLASAEPPHLNVTSHEVSPSEIWTSDSGMSPDESRVTLNVRGEGDPIPVAVVLAIDFSGSMTTTDPEDKRVDAAKSFTTMMDPERDKVGRVIWSDEVLNTVPLTSDFKEINAPLDRIEPFGATNFNKALNRSIDILEDASNNSRKHIIFLSDGVPECPDGKCYNLSTVIRAKDRGIVIHTVGLGDRSGEKILKEMADTTGGGYHPAPDSSHLESVYQDISKDIFLAGKNVTVMYRAPAALDYSIEPDVESGDDKMFSRDLGPISVGETKPMSFDVSSAESGEFPLGIGPGSEVIYTRHDDTPARIPIEERTLIVKENLPPTVTSLTPNPRSPQPSGTVVEWTAEATDPENDPLVYQFQLNGEDPTGWTNDNTWTWNTSSADVVENEIEVRVRDKNHAGPEGYDDFKVENYSVEENLPPNITNLTPNPRSPQPSGTVVEWTAEATDPENDPLVYQFQLNGEDPTDWTNDNTWTWNTSPLDVGENEVEVRVRDKHHAGPEGYDDFKVENYSVKENLPPNITSLTPNLRWPQPSGTVVEWTANATDPENDPIVYKFWLNGADQTGWTNDNTWTWNISLAENVVEVWIRDKHHAGPEGYDDSEVGNYPINGTPTIINLTATPPSPQPNGTVVEWTAEAIDPENDPIEYKFWLNGADQTGWTNDNTWTWNTSPLDVGENVVEVWVRDHLHAGLEGRDDSKAEEYTIGDPPNATVTKEIVRGEEGTCLDINLTVQMSPGHNITSDIDVVFALDTSYSMEEKVGQREWMINVTRVLLDDGPFDKKFNVTRIAIVSWDDDIDFRPEMFPLRGNESKAMDILDNLVFGEDESTVYDVGLSESVRVLDENSLSARTNTERAIIFVTGTGEFKPGDGLNDTIRTATERGYRTYTVGLEIRKADSRMKFDWLEKMANETGGEFYQILDSSEDLSPGEVERGNVFLAEDQEHFLNSIENVMLAIYEELENRPVATNVTLNDTLFPYLQVEGTSPPANTTKINPDGTTTLVWNIGNMAGSESRTFTIHTSLYMKVPADVNIPNRGPIYAVDGSTPPSELSYTWLDTGEYRTVGIPAGEITIKCGDVG